MAKPFNRVIGQEFYANLKKIISNMNSLFYEQVYVCGHMFDFSPILISSCLNCLIVHSSWEKELDLNVDMYKVAVELNGNTHFHRPA